MIDHYIVYHSHYIVELVHYIVELVHYIVYQFHYIVELLHCWLLPFAKVAISLKRAAGGFLEGPLKFWGYMVSSSRAALSAMSC